MTECSMVVTLSPPEPAVPASAKTLSLLHELATLLDRQITTGKPGSIDIGRIPLSAAERQWLEQVVGTGEVEVKIYSGGLTQIRETGVPGVWWIDYCDNAGAIITRCIDVTDIPELLRSDQKEMRQGLTRLRRKLGMLP